MGRRVCPRRAWSFLEYSMPATQARNMNIGVEGRIFLLLIGRMDITFR